MPQNSVNQRPTMALFSCSFDMVLSWVVVSATNLQAPRLAP